MFQAPDPFPPSPSHSRLVCSHGHAFRYLETLFHCSAWQTPTQASKPSSDIISVKIPDSHQHSPHCSYLQGTTASVCAPSTYTAGYSPLPHPPALSHRPSSRGDDASQTLFCIKTTGTPQGVGSENLNFPQAPRSWSCCWSRAHTVRTSAPVSKGTSLRPVLL